MHKMTSIRDCVTLYYCPVGGNHWRKKVRGIPSNFKTMAHEMKEGRCCFYSELLSTANITFGIS